MAIRYYVAFPPVSEPSIIRRALDTPSRPRRRSDRQPTGAAAAADLHRRHRRHLHVSAARDHRACVALRIHPNTLTLIGVIINVARGVGARLRRFVLAGVIMIVANIFDFIDGKVAHELQLQSRFGAFWDSTLDRFSDLALLTGLIFLYSKLGRSDYVMVAALTLIFSIMTSYARARAESLVEKCKVGFMERPERIVLFMIGAFTNRMAGVLWVILVLSILAVANRIYYTYLALNGLPMPTRSGVARRLQPRVLLDRRTHHAALRPLGDRDPRVRVAGAARLARRSHGQRPGTAGDRCSQLTGYN